MWKKKIIKKMENDDILRSKRCKNNVRGKKDKYVQGSTKGETGVNHKYCSKAYHQRWYIKVKRVCRMMEATRLLLISATLSDVTPAQMLGKSGESWWAKSFIPHGTKRCIFYFSGDNRYTYSFIHHTAALLSADCTHSVAQCVIFHLCN